MVINLTVCFDTTFKILKEAIGFSFWIKLPIFGGKGTENRKMWIRTCRERIVPIISFIAPWKTRLSSEVRIVVPTIALLVAPVP